MLFKAPSCAFPARSQVRHQKHHVHVCVCLRRRGRQAAGVFPLLRSTGGPPLFFFISFPFLLREASRGSLSRLSCIEAFLFLSLSLSRGGGRGLSLSPFSFYFPPWRPSYALSKAVCGREIPLFNLFKVAFFSLSLSLSLVRRISYKKKKKQKKKNGNHKPNLHGLERKFTPRSSSARGWRAGSKGLDLRMNILRCPSTRVRCFVLLPVARALQISR